MDFLATDHSPLCDTDASLPGGSRSIYSWALQWSVEVSTQVTALVVQ